MNPDDTYEVDELPAQPRKNIPAADLELLELAARALGARFEEVEGEGYGNLYFPDGSIIHAWNSLQFSGDTFDMVVRLRLTVEVFDSGVVCKGVAGVRNEEALGQLRHVFAQETPGPDPVAATRRAVTRAAAEIGKQRS